MAHWGGVNNPLTSCNSNVQRYTDIELKLEFIKGPLNIFRILPSFDFCTSVRLVLALPHTSKMLAECAENYCFSHISSKSPLNIHNAATNSDGTIGRNTNVSD